MSQSLRALLVAIACMPGFAAAGGGAGTPVDADLAAWRADRLRSLTSDDGFLTLVGLYWLEPGRSSFGRARGNSFVLEHPRMPRRLGTFERIGNEVRFSAARGVEVWWRGQAVQRIMMRADTSGDPTVLRHERLEFFVIERSGRLGLRVRDLDSQRRRDFAGLEHFPADAAWRIEARFEAYEPPRRIPILNILGMESEMPSPGAIVFEKDGRSWRLDAIDQDPESPTLFVMFADATSGRDSYGAGRFLDVPRPRDGRVVIDFNRAYSPPCAFNEFATCPLPPPQNRLELSVTAGERTFPPTGAAH